MKKLFYKGCLFIIFIASSFNAIAQNDLLKIDSLKKVLITQKEDSNKANTLNALSFSFKNNFQTDSQYANQELLLSKKINYKKGEANAYRQFGYISFNRNNYPEALKFFYSSLKIMQAISDDKGIANAYSAIGDTYAMENNSAEEIKNYFAALDFYKKADNKKGIAQTYILIGQYYNDEGNYPEEIKNFYAALRLSQEIADTSWIALSFQNLCNAYHLQANYPEALKNALLSLQFFAALHDTDNITLNYSQIGEEYFEMKYYDKALRQYDSTLKTLANWQASEEMKAVTYAYTYMGIGNVYEKVGERSYPTKNKTSAINNFSEAKKNYLKALGLFNSNDKQYLADAYNNLGSVDIKLNDFTEARNYIIKSIEISTGLNNKRILSDSYENLSKLDSGQRNYKEAFRDFKKYILYHDSLINDVNSRKISQSSMQYEFDKKEATTKAAQLKKDAEEQRVKNQQLFAILALGIIVLAVVVIALIQFRNNKQKQKTNKVLETTLSNLKSTQAQLIQSEKMASLGELTAGIAHEIQNPLNFVNNFSDVNKELLEELKDEAGKGNIEEVKAIANDVIGNEEKINHHGKRADAIVKGMLQHSRSSTGVKESTDINTLADEYLRLSYHGMRAKNKSFNAEIKTDFDNSIQKINIVPQDIGRVLLNLYNNAFYAVTEKTKQRPDGYEPTISVSIKKINNKIKLTVKDNGNGIPQKIVDKIFQPFFTTKPTGEGTGLGLSLSYDIIKAHGGEIKAETKEGEGSEFIIQLPITA